MCSDKLTLKEISEMNFIGTEHFSVQELSCNCGCGKCDMDMKFMLKLEELRKKCGFPFYINSGFRCPYYNGLIGSSDRSAHTKGLAVDIAISDSTKRYCLVKYALELGFNRVGIGNGFIHIDSSEELPQNVMWCYY